MAEITYNDDFTYTHKNPYHDKLKEFDHFVLRDREGEGHKGNWNKNVFDREAPLCVEIGSGYGHFMLDYCQKNPHVNFIGMDYRFKRSYQLARKLSKLPEEAKSFRYLRAKGERLEFLFEEGEVDTLFYFFPDPWPKARHLKKRLFQNRFLESAAKVLRPGGKLYIKTDHDGYAEHMEEVINNSTSIFELKYQTKDLWATEDEPFLSSFKTKFEKIFCEQKINIKGFVLEVKKGD